MSNNQFFLNFKTDIKEIVLPQKFTFPFYYTPHEISQIAAEELQEYLINQNDFDHNFWETGDDSDLVIGKMFGVLVVKNLQGELGYLAAFSGKLGESNRHKYFVPPIYDLWDDNPYYLEKSTALKELSKQIDAYKNRSDFIELKKQIEEEEAAFAEQQIIWKKELKSAKTVRAQKRADALKFMSDEEYLVLCEQLKHESIHGQTLVKKAIAEKKQKIQNLKEEYNQLNITFHNLKKKRKRQSQSLQKWIFEQYSFLNAKGERKNLNQIFSSENNTPIPSGAGECAAPKLLQYAYFNKLEPIAMAEFWWGTYPKSEIRKHQYYYPACKSKCEPILGHMLKGLNVDDNPLIKEISLEKELPIIFEDEWILAVNKPHEMLSVPGIKLKDSVQSRLEELYPKRKPLLLHRLDMSTSGVLLFAKDKGVHKHIQSQFIKKKIKKEYLAILDGIPESSSGRIDFPIRVDLDDRPRQLLCYEYGKQAITDWELVNILNDRDAVIRFYPVTGRTHQLRVHAAHQKGLNKPIKGDDLYGKKSERLYLHAEKITFMHPVTKKLVTISAPCEFYNG